MWLKFIIFLAFNFKYGGSTREVFNIKTMALPTLQSSEVSVGSRIVGGAPASINQYPYTVQVQYNNRLSCGGSLLTARHVLSAAHCFVDERSTPVSPSLFSIRVGTAATTSGGSVYAVSTIVIHERYNQPVRDNDVAVLVLSSTVVLGTSVDTISIPIQGISPLDNSTVIHVGWGRTNQNINQVATTLNEVYINVINREICFERYALLSQIRGEPYPITSNMICAGILNIGGKDACQGDSGGPLVYPTQKGPVLVGVTSWGEGCGHPTFPGVSANVASYSTWINSTIHRYNNAVHCKSGLTLVILSVTIGMILYH